MNKNREVIEILNDLVKINNDRVEGYKMAVKELKGDDVELKSLFDRMIAQSMQMKSDLTREIEVLHGDMDKGTTVNGKIYRGWMSLKAIFSGEDRHTILANCEQVEDATQRAYEHALENEALPEYLADLLNQQRGILRDSHDRMKELRNVHA